MPPPQYCDRTTVHAFDCIAPPTPKVTRDDFEVIASAAGLRDAASVRRAYDSVDSYSAVRADYFHAAQLEADRLRTAQLAARMHRGRTGSRGLRPHTGAHPMAPAQEDPSRGGELDGLWW